MNATSGKTASHFMSVDIGIASSLGRPRNGQAS